MDQKKVLGGILNVERAGRAGAHSHQEPNSRGETPLAGATGRSPFIDSRSDTEGPGEQTPCRVCLHLELYPAVPFVQGTRAFCCVPAVRPAFSPGQRTNTHAASALVAEAVLLTVRPSAQRFRHVSNEPAQGTRPEDPDSRPPVVRQAQQQRILAARQVRSPQLQSTTNLGLSHA